LFEGCLITFFITGEPLLIQSVQYACAAAQVLFPNSRAAQKSNIVMTNERGMVTKVVIIGSQSQYFQILANRLGTKKAAIRQPFLLLRVLLLELELDR
jgi:hypothetical protein